MIKGNRSGVIEHTTIKLLDFNFMFLTRSTRVIFSGITESEQWSEQVHNVFRLLNALSSISAESERGFSEINRSKGSKPLF